MEPKKRHLLSPTLTKPAFSLHGPHSPLPFPARNSPLSITDKHGKELWSLKNPEGQGNPGVIIYDVQINLITEREFGRFCQNTWAPPLLSPIHCPQHQTPPETRGRPPATKN